MSYGEFQSSLILLVISITTFETTHHSGHTAHHFLGERHWCLWTSTSISAEWFATCKYDMEMAQKSYPGIPGHLFGPIFEPNYAKTYVLAEWFHDCTCNSNNWDWYIMAMCIYWYISVWKCILAQNCIPQNADWHKLRNEQQCWFSPNNKFAKFIEC